MDKFLALVILLSVFAWVQLLHPAEFYDSHERLAPLFRLVELNSCLREGVFPVRWAPDTYGGRGSPYFNFYAPLFYYLAEIPHLLGLSVLWSVKISIAIVFISSGIFMFLLVKRLAGERAGFFAGVLYMYSPFLLLDVYIRGSLGEALAMAVLPLVLYSLHKPSPLLGGAAYAALILSHNALALLATPFLILYSLCLCAKRELGYKEASLVFLLGLGLSAFFWTPAISEMNGVKMEWILIYDYKDAFKGLTEIVSPMGHFMRATIEDKTSLQLGVPHLFFALLAYPLVRTSYSRWVLSLLILSFFMITPYSMPLWSLLPLGGYVQFPWRLFAIAALFSSILGGMALGVLSARLPSKWLAALALMIVLSSINFIGYSTRIPVEHDTINATKLREYYDSGLSYGHEYLPREAIVPASSVTKKVEVKKGDARVVEVREGCASMEFKTIGSGDIKINTNWFPGWAVRVDGLPASLYIDEEGLMVIPLNDGPHDVLVKFENTGFRTVSNASSFVSLLLMLFLSRKRGEGIEG